MAPGRANASAPTAVREPAGCTRRGGLQLRCPRAKPFPSASRGDSFHALSTTVHGSGDCGAASSRARSSAGRSSATHSSTRRIASAIISLSPATSWAGTSPSRARGAPPLWHLPSLEERCPRRCRRRVLVAGRRRRGEPAGRSTRGGTSLGGPGDRGPGTDRGPRGAQLPQPVDLRGPTGRCWPTGLPLRPPDRSPAAPGPARSCCCGRPPRGWPIRGPDTSSGRR